MDNTLIIKNQKNYVRICQTHRNPVDYIDIFDNTNKPFNCIRCARDKGIKLEGLLRFSELLDEDDYDSLSNFPPLEESIPQRMREVSKLLDKHEGLLQNIEKYFEDIQTEIETYISSAKNQAKGKAVKLLQSNEEIFKKYNEVSFRKELRKILREGDEQMESKVSQILAKVTKQEDIQRNSRIIGQCLDENMIWRESVNFNIPSKIKDTILNLISKIDFFSGVSEEQFEEVEKQSQLLRNQQFDQKDNSNCNLLIDLISSKANFCQEDFLNKTIKMIESLSFYINSHNLGENPFKVEDRDAFENLNESQMKQIAELSKKIRKVSEAYDRQNISEEEICLTIQPKTCLVFQNPNIISQQKELKLLFKQFPIIELSPIDQVREQSILSQVDLIKSQYSSSQKLIITKQGNGYLEANNNENGNKVCYCNFVLDKTKQYIFRVQLFQNNNNSNNQFFFGLILESQKDSHALHVQNMIYDERNSINKMNKIVKGDRQVARGNGNPVNRELEIRICLEKQILKVSDYPNYSCVCELDDPNKIRSEFAYRFAMETYHSSRMLITEIIEVFSFDLKM